MADGNMQLQWTDEQWNKVRQVVFEEARKARVAGSFLPLYGPLEPDARYVADELVTYGGAPPSLPSLPGVPAAALAGATVSIDDLDTLRLTTLQVEVFLTGAQVADPQLSSALTAFRRAANIVARLEDEIVFNGQPAAGSRPPLRNTVAGLPPIDRVLIGDVIGGDPTDGLLGPAVNRGLPVARVPGPPTQATRSTRFIVRSASSGATTGNALVEMVSHAIGVLEGGYFLGPFACVLGHKYFTAVQTPQPGLSNVLPQDQILAFLGGAPLLRTSTLPEDVGLVIALGSEPVDLVVGTDISVKFLQATFEPRFVFRVYEKVVLRIKQSDAIAVLHI